MIQFFFKHTLTLINYKHVNYNKEILQHTVITKLSLNFKSNENIDINHYYCTLNKLLCKIFPTFKIFFLTFYLLLLV